MGMGDYKYNQRRARMRTGELFNRSERVFFKDFIKTTEKESNDAGQQSEKGKLHKLERSNVAIKRMLKEIQNSHKDRLKKREGSPQRLSATRQEKRTSVEDYLIHNDSNFIARGVHRKAAEFVRSKNIGQALEGEGEGESKYAKIVEFNKKFRERRENSLKLMANQTYHSRFKDQEKICRISNNLKSMTTELNRTPTMPLQGKHKSSKHFDTKEMKTPFEVSESQESFQSNLLNPEPSDKFLVRQEGSDSAKRFYMKLKKNNKLGNIFSKPMDKQFSLLQSQSVSKEIPSQLGIYKILLPKRNHRHEFLQNIQKIKESYLRIKGQGQKETEHREFTEFKRRQGTEEKSIKKYEIKYRRMKSPKKEQKLMRSKTQFFHNRSEWQAFVSAPFEPWETQEANQAYK